MELSSHGEGEIPIPINSSFGGHGHGHLIHHHHPSAVVMPHNHILTSPPSAPTHNNNNNNNNNGLNPNSTNSASSLEIDHHHNNNNNYNNSSSSSKKQVVIKYRECLKNHAAGMGGNATDGCGEFMPSGEEGSIEALTCSACNCHRNFHRKEIEGHHDDDQLLIHPCDTFYPPHFTNNKTRKLILGHHKTIVHAPQPLAYPTVPGAGHHQQQQHHPHMFMSYNMAAHGSLPSESDEQEDGINGGGGGVVASRTHHLHQHHHQHQQQLVKKRFRTKFTAEQKEKMLNFAERVGWKIQKQEESVVQQFCQEIGIKRRVLKVWMHNNKHNLANKTTTTTVTNIINPSSATTTAAATT